MLKDSVIIYIFLAFVLYKLKPSLLFKTEGGRLVRRDYGFGRRDGHKKTVFDIHNIMILLAIFSYFSVN